MQDSRKKMAGTFHSFRWRPSWKTWVKVESALLGGKQPRPIAPGQIAKGVETKAPDWVIEWYSIKIISNICNCLVTAAFSRPWSFRASPKICSTSPETRSRTPVSLKWLRLPLFPCLSTTWQHRRWVLSPKHTINWINNPCRQLTIISRSRRQIIQTVRKQLINVTICSSTSPHLSRNSACNRQPLANTSRSPWLRCERMERSMTLLLKSNRNKIIRLRTSNHRCR